MTGARRRLRTASLAVVALAVLAGVPAACSSSSGTTELAHDIGDDTVPGNLPTAPPRNTGGDPGLAAGANVLLAELDQIREETDLCVILSGQAFEGLVGGFDTAGLVTNPAGLTRLLTAIDAVFAHVVEIAPPELRPAMQTVRDVWTQVAALGPVSDPEARLQEILSGPQVVAATDAILAWVPANCAAAIAGAAG